MKQVINGIEKTSSEFRLEVALSGNITYIGKATLNSLVSESVWQIKKIDETTGISITWANGNANFDKIWNNRESYSYT